MLGSLFFIDNNYEKASKNYYQAIQKFNKLNISTPSNIKLSFAKSLIEMKDKKSLKKSLLILEELIPIKYNSIYFWKLIGKTADKLGDIPVSMVAIAEEKILKKQYKKAKMAKFLIKNEFNSFLILWIAVVIESVSYLKSKNEKSSLRFSAMIIAATGLKENFLALFCANFPSKPRETSTVRRVRKAISFMEIEKLDL